MFTLKADLTIDEILNPSVLWCKSGHDVPSGCRMYKVSGNTLPKSSWGDYCQDCITIVNQIVAARKKANVSQSVPDEPEVLSFSQLRRKMIMLGFTGGIAETESQEKPEWERFIEECK